MLIESIKLKSNRNSNIFLLIVDGEEYIFHCDAIVKFGFSTDREITDEQFKKAKAESDYIICLNTANNYLGANLKTTKQLKDYLNKKGFEKSIVSKVMEKLKEYGVINDEGFAKTFIRCNSNKFSKRVLEQKLLQKGIKKEKFNDELVELDDRELCLKFAEKFIKNKILDNKTKEKLLRHLQYKGFNYEDINYVLKNLNIEEN